ncbi:MAG: class I SAM-dependent methyltransferase [Prevotellaceae bacterium]|jgi:2-polyprenyl-3-methyl-5-hydroxy-6-metoxy-1,4-benzoquinol methylase|nr:class I SAM-dependent methyltransferase [Prevotellaceae bacterium]
MGNQKQIWEKYWQEQDYTAECEVKEYHRDIKQMIMDSCKQAQTAIEVGSGIGITSLLLSDTLQCTLLDFDEGVLQKASSLFRWKQQKAQFICCDMFHLDEVKEKYDVVFNSGVIEHYTLKERTVLLKEYQKVLKHQGTMVIAVPNHYCIPYKLGYVILRFLGRWKYPEEYAIKDLSRELQDTDLHCVHVITTSDNLIEDSIGNRHLKRLYVCLKMLFQFQGYLRIFIIKNKEL